MIEVSIIVPVYNKEKELRRCLDSLTNQTINNLEIIVIDDKSTDDSKKIIKEYYEKYPKKVIPMYNDKNEGIGFCRNKGIKKAKGEYLGFVDADDYVDFKMYEKYLEFAKNNSLEIVTGYYIKCGMINELFKNEYFSIGSLKENSELLLKLDYGPCNKLFKKSLIIDNNILFEEKLKYEDMPFVLKSLKNANKIGHINKAYYYYYIHSNSETTTVDKRVFDIFKIMKIINKYYSDYENLECLDALNILQITRYMVQQRYQCNHNIANSFINYGYQYLNAINKNWRKNRYYLKENFLKRIIKNNKFILKVYCFFYKIFNR